MNEKTEFLKGFSQFLGACYATNIIGTFGHEMGHSLIPRLYGEKVLIRVQAHMGGQTFFSTMRMPAKYFPAVLACGPIAGIITSLTLLKIFHTLRDCCKNPDNHSRFLLNQRLFNDHVFHGIIYGTLFSYISDAVNLCSKDPGSDGQQLCNHFKLTTRQAFFTRSAMALGALTFAGTMMHILKMDGVYKSFLTQNNFFKLYKSVEEINCKKNPFHQAVHVSIKGKCSRNDVNVSNFSLLPATVEGAKGRMRVLSVALIQVKVYSTPSRLPLLPEGEDRELLKSPALSDHLLTH